MVLSCSSTPTPACSLFLLINVISFSWHAGTALQNPVQPDQPQLSNKSAVNSPGNHSGFHGMADGSWWLASMERTSPTPSHRSPTLPLDKVWQRIISLWGQKSSGNKCKTKSGEFSASWCEAGKYAGKSKYQVHLFWPLRAIRPA